MYPYKCKECGGAVTEEEYERDECPFCGNDEFKQVVFDYDTNYI